MPFKIVALSEVGAEDSKRFDGKFGSFFGVVSETGGEDRLVISWSKRFELVRQVQVENWPGEDRPVDTFRRPLVVHLTDTYEPTEEFLLVNNHLARGDAELRRRQAERLVEWASEQTLPIIAVGVYNMDLSLATLQGNSAFDAMLRGDVFRWIEPETLIDTNWADHNQDGLDDYPDSMLDFVFVANGAKKWDVQCRILAAENDFPDDETTSDHRPVLTTIR